MGKILKDYLEKEKNGVYFCCAQCSTELASDKEIISKNFHSLSGRAYLFNTVYGFPFNTHMTDIPVSRNN